MLPKWQTTPGSHLTDANLFSNNDNNELVSVNRVYVVYVDTYYRKYDVEDYKHH